jgi:HAD superfamily hydrolase (TIGR01549 family)
VPDILTYPTDDELKVRWSQEARKWIVVADMDGTIIDSERANFNILEHILQEFGLTGQRHTILKGLAEGKDFIKIMKEIEVTKETKEEMEKLLVSLLTQVPIPSLPGAVDNLRFLRDLGILFTLATDNYYPFVERVINELGIADVFDSRFILTSDNFSLRKPSSNMVKELMDRSGRSKVIIIGNTPKEMAMAQNAKCPAIILTDGKGMHGDTASKKETFEYEWWKFGDFKGKDIYPVENWEEVKNRIVQIIQRESLKGT